MKKILNEKYDEIYNIIQQKENSDININLIKEKQENEEKIKILKNENEKLLISLSENKKEIVKYENILEKYENTNKEFEIKIENL